MAITITTIAEGDLIRDSRSTINTNFSNLAAGIDPGASGHTHDGTDSNQVETTDLGVTGLTALQFVRVNAGGTALESATEAGLGDVTKVGTPTDSQVGVWTGDGTIEGASSLTYDGSNFQLTGDIGSTGTRITKGWFTDLEVTNAIAGSVTGNAGTVTTITGLAPDTATTQATQPNITTMSSLTSIQGNTVTLTGDFIRSGAHSLTLTTTGATNVTLPTSGTLLSTAGGTLTGNINLGEGEDAADRGIQFDESLSADERFSGIHVAGTAGATLAFGDLCYLDVTATEWLLADASAASTAGTVPLGICLDASTDGAATSMLLMGTVRSAAFPASIALGAPLYVSETAGDMTATAPSTTDAVVRVCGFAVTAEPNTIYFNPSMDHITVV